MKNDPVIAGAIAVVSAMILCAIKSIYPQVFYGVLITLILYGIHLIKSNGNL